MLSNKYYDWSLHRVLNESDGCRYEDWEYKSDNYPFALHHKGFPVFVSTHELENSDEYSEGDTVDGLNVAFRFHRIQIIDHIVSQYSLNYSHWKAAKSVLQRPPV